MILAQSKSAPNPARPAAAGQNQRERFRQGWAAASDSGRRSSGSLKLIRLFPRSSGRPELSGAIVVSMGAGVARESGAALVWPATSRRMVGVSSREAPLPVATAVPTDALENGVKGLATSPGVWNR